MSNRSIELSPALYDYLLAHSLRETEVQRQLRAHTAQLPDHNMQIAPSRASSWPCWRACWAPAGRSKSASIPVTARCAWRPRCPPTAAWWPAI